MSPVTIPTQQQKTLHSQQPATSSQQLTQSHTMELTAASVPAGFPLNYQQLYASNAALYGAPVMFSGAIHAAHASYMASHGLPLHAALSPNETYLKAIQAAACGIYSPTALAPPVNHNLVNCKTASIHNPMGSMMALAPSAPVSITKSPQYTTNDMLNKAEAEQKKDYHSTTSTLNPTTVMTRLGCDGSNTGTYLNDKVNEANSDGANDSHFKVPNGKEGSLKHRILRPPSSESAEGSKTPVMRTYDTTSNFKKGTYIELANGALRRVEDMRTEDFIQCAERSPNHQLAESTVVKINTSQSSTAVITFSYDRNRSKVDMEVSLDHPFFVYGQGWASCNPDMSMQVFGLRCQRLQVGDICISLTKRPTPPPTSSTEAHNSQRRHSISSITSSNATNTITSNSLPTTINSTIEMPYTHLNPHAFTLPAPSSHQQQQQHHLPAYAEMAKQLMTSYAFSKGLPPISHEQLKDVVFDATILQSLSPKMVNAFYQSQMFQFSQHQSHQSHQQQQQEFKYCQERTPPLSSAHNMVSFNNPSSHLIDMEQTQSSQTQPLDASLSRKRRWSAPENMFDDDEADTQPPRNSHHTPASNAMSPSATART